MKTVPIADVNSTLDNWVDVAQSEPVVIMKSGKPVAALVSLETLRASGRDVLALWELLHPPNMPGPDIGPYIGAARGLFGSPEEVDAYIRRERDEW
jgi:antitoxin (DNA-binding transcriptional repressor) of toxin-antitoxin stability system